MALGWVGLATPIYNIGMTYVTTELSNMSKKKKKTIDCKKVRLCVMLVLPNMTIKLSNVRKK